MLTRVPDNSMGGVQTAPILAVSQKIRGMRGRPVSQKIRGEGAQTAAMLAVSQKIRWDRVQTAAVPDRKPPAGLPHGRVAEN